MSMSMNDTNNKLTLYLLELLLHADGPMSIGDLYDHLSHPTVTEKMRECITEGESGLRRFLVRYPALFRVNGSLVVPAMDDSSDASPLAEQPRLSRHDSFGSSHSTSSNNYDFGLESEAVRYFQQLLSRREERWVPITSLAGHLSQASSRVRRAVGPQVEFTNFLLRHPHVFEIQGELVGLKDTFSSSCLQTSASSAKRRSDRGSFSKHQRPKSLNCSNWRAERLLDQAGLPPPLSNGHGLGGSFREPSRDLLRIAPIAMTANEYKTVIFVRNKIDANNGCMSLANIIRIIGQAPEHVRNTIGWTKIELEEFLRKNSLVFDIGSGDVVFTKDVRKLNVIITGSKPMEPSTHTLTNRKGTVFHVAKLWGIIDLGQHEHVFFDKSIIRHVNDLQRHFKMGETLYFNAILAAKNSRAKWRATQVWKESDRELVEALAGGALGAQGEDTDSGMDADTHEECFQLADDIKFLDDDLEDGEEFARIVRLNEGTELDSPDLDLCDGGFNSVRMAAPDDTWSSPRGPASPVHSEPSTMQSIPSISAETEDLPLPPPTRTVATQTVATGEIMATQFYHDGMSQLV